MKRFVFFPLILLLAFGQTALSQSTTTNLDITKPATGQAQPQVTIATGFDSFDAAVAGRLSKSVAGSSNVTLTTAEARNQILEFTGILTGSINVIVPTKNRTYLVYNGTTGAFTLTVKTAAGTGIAVTQGNRVWLYCDATNVVESSVSGGGANNTLSNLSTTSINTSLLAQTGVDLGAAATPFRDLYLFGSGTYGSHSLKFTGTPTGNRTITVPDRTATMATTSGTLTNGKCVEFDASGNLVVAVSNAACGAGGGGGAWSALTDPAGNLALAMSTHLTTLTWAGNYSTSSAFKLTGANTSATGPLVEFSSGFANNMPVLKLTPRGGRSFEALYTGSLLLGKDAPGSGDADGYIYLGVIGSNAAPSGTPTSNTGFAPLTLEADGTNSEYALWSYLGSAWRDLSGVVKRWDTGSGSGAQTIDFNSSTSAVVSRQFTLSGNVTFTFSNPPKAGALVSLKIIQNGTGGWGITWPAVVDWPGGTPFGPTTNANAKDVYLFLWDGSNYLFISQSQDIQ